MGPRKTSLADACRRCQLVREHHSDVACTFQYGCCPPHGARLPAFQHGTFVDIDRFDDQVVDVHFLGIFRAGKCGPQGLVDESRPLLRGESENSEGFSNPLPADEICYESSFIRCNAQVFGNRSRLHRYFPFTRDFLSPL